MATLHILFILYYIYIIYFQIYSILNHKCVCEYICDLRFNKFENKFFFYLRKVLFNIYPLKLVEHINT